MSTREVEDAFLAQQVMNLNEQAREKAGEAWSRAHPLPDGALFGWPYDYDMAKTHYHINPLICSNCSFKTEGWYPRGKKRPSRIDNPYPCRKCDVRCHVTVGRWG